MYFSTFYFCPSSGWLDPTTPALRSCHTILLVPKYYRDMDVNYKPFIYIFFTTAGFSKTSCHLSAPMKRFFSPFCFSSSDRPPAINPTHPRQQDSRRKREQCISQQVNIIYISIHFFNITQVSSLIIFLITGARGYKHW